jgi:hypothetical protein
MDKPVWQNSRTIGFGWLDYQPTSFIPLLVSDVTLFDVK